MCDICGQSSHLVSPVSSRRHFLKLAAGAAAGLAISGKAFAAGDAAPKPQNVLSPDEALKRLKAGNLRYINGTMKRHDFETERETLAGGQNPYAGILSCADSRIGPEFAFDTARGDLFVVRVAGNFANEDGVASFEYAVKFLGMPLLVVLGHDKCGAVDATIKAVKDGAEMPGHIPYLVDRIKPAVTQAMKESGDLLENSIRDNVLLNVAKLKASSPILDEAVNAGKIRVVGGIYKLKTGGIDWLL